MAEHALCTHVPIKVGSDVAFINGLMHVLITEELYAKEYVASCTVGFEELKAKVMEWPPERAAGDSRGAGRNASWRWPACWPPNQPAMLIYTLGITEHTCGVNNVL